MQLNSKLESNYTELLNLNIPGLSVGRLNSVFSDSPIVARDYKISVPAEVSDKVIDSLNKIIAFEVEGTGYFVELPVFSGENLEFQLLADSFFWEEFSNTYPTDFLQEFLSSVIDSFSPSTLSALG